MADTGSENFGRWWIGRIPGAAGGPQVVANEAPGTVRGHRYRFHCRELRIAFGAMSPGSIFLGPEDDYDHQQLDT